MKLNRLKTLLSGILAGALLMALAFGFAVSAAPKATQADSIVGTRSITLESQAASTTRWIYSDAAYTQFYVTASCFSTWTAAPILVGEPVTLTMELREAIKAASPHAQLIAQRVIDLIRAKYPLDEELYFARIAVGALQNSYTLLPGEAEALAQYQTDVEAAREWGRTERAKIGL